VATFKGTVTRDRGKKVQTDDGKEWTTVPDGTETADINLTIDMAALLKYLGTRAMASRGKKSVEARGMIQARAYNIRRTP
jgi:hypothetical protein